MGCSMKPQWDLPCQAPEVDRDADAPWSPACQLVVPGSCVCWATGSWSCVKGRRGAGGAMQSWELWEIPGFCAGNPLENII